MPDSPTLGKIQNVSFGHGGYQDAMIGISFTLGGDGWGVCDFWGDWALKRSDNAKWSEQDRIDHLGEMVMKINSLMEDAKVHSVEKLKGIPVRVYFKDFNSLDRWEVLKEVL